jgi:hypothetical protein
MAANWPANPEPARSASSNATAPAELLGPSGRLPPSEPARPDTSVRRQGGVRQALRPTRLGLLAARLHGKARPQVAGVGGETQQARHGDKQEQAKEHQSEHGKNYAVAKK